MRSVTGRNLTCRGAQTEKIQITYFIFADIGSINFFCNSSIKSCVFRVDRTYFSIKFSVDFI